MIKAEGISIDLKRAAPGNHFGDPIPTERPGWFLYVSESRMSRAEVAAIRHKLGPLFRFERMRRFIFVEVSE